MEQKSLNGRLPLKPFHLTDYVHPDTRNCPCAAVLHNCYFPLFFVFRKKRETNDLLSSSLPLHIYYQTIGTCQNRKETKKRALLKTNRRIRPISSRQSRRETIGSESLTHTTGTTTFIFYLKRKTRVELSIFIKISPIVFIHLSCYGFLFETNKQGSLFFIKIFGEKAKYNPRERGFHDDGRQHAHSCFFFPLE